MKTDEKKKKVSIFMESIETNENGEKVYTYSMRRTCAFIMFIIAALLGILSIALPLVTAIINYSTGNSFDLLLDWKVTLVALGVPAVIGVLLLFITSWSDIQNTVTGVMGAMKK